MSDANVTSNVTCLVASNVDLRDFVYMPLDVVRLRDSDLAAIATGDAFRAAVMLWCAAWHQVPAASLPTDDRMLARYAGYGRDVAAWSEVKDDALRGFVLCDDGRLYHPVIAEKAVEAWNAKEAQRARTSIATAARLAKQREASRDEPDDEQRDEPRNVQRDEPRNVVQGKGREQKVSKGIPSKIEKQKTRERELSRIPEDWEPIKSELDYALNEGLAVDDVARAVVEFRDTWLGRGEARGDWSAEWRGYVRGRLKRKPKANANAPRAGPANGHAMVGMRDRTGPQVQIPVFGEVSVAFLRQELAGGRWRESYGDADKVLKITNPATIPAADQRS